MIDDHKVIRFVEVGGVPYRSGYKLCDEGGIIKYEVDSGGLCILFVG